MFLINTRSDRKYPCQYCNSSFKRLEHLKRHQFSHSVKRSGIKPFQCHSCRKYYSRFDSLKLHASNSHSLDLVWKEYKHLINGWNPPFRNKIQDLIN